METTIFLLKFVLFCIFGGILFVICYFAWCGYKDWREAQKLTFDIMYKNIERILRSYPVNERNMNRLLGYFGQIRKLRYKNVEKIQVLWIEYREKYRDLGREIMSESEHDPSMIFAGE